MSDDRYIDLAAHDHRCAPADAVIEIEDVRIVHADAAVGDEAADRARVVGAVDGVFPAAAQRHGSRAHGIAWASARNHTRQRGLVALDFVGRRPCRAQLLAVDHGGAGPLFTGTADPDRIAHCLAVAEHVIERPLAGFHYHRAARISV